MNFFTGVLKDFTYILRTPFEATPILSHVLTLALPSDFEEPPSLSGAQPPPCSQHLWETLSTYCCIIKYQAKEKHLLSYHDASNKEIDIKDIL